MDEKQFKKLLQVQNQEISKCFEKKLNLSFDLVTEKVNNRLTRHSKELKEDYARQGKFLLEQFQKQVSVVAEQFSSLNKKIDDVKKTSNATFEEVGKLKVDIEVVKEDIKTVKDDMRIVKNELKRKVDIEAFEALEKEVMVLEKQFQSIHP